MGFIRNILFLSFCWSVGTTLFAATSCLLDNQDAVAYVDPRLPKIQANFAHEVDSKLDIQSSASPSVAAVLGERFLALTSECCGVNYSDPRHRGIKKHYLFTSSGTSPPSVS